MKKKIKVGVIQKVHTSYVVPVRRKNPIGKNGNQKVKTVETELRHYCRKCKRKRIESVMHVVGTAKFGKRSWECNDTKGCNAVTELKKKSK